VSSYLGNANVPGKAIQERLGHTTEAMTDLYVHALPTGQDAAVKALEKLLG
jgi:integrase